MFKLLDCFRVPASDLDERDAEQLTRLDGIGIRREELFESLDSTLELPRAIMGNAEVEIDLRQLRREPQSGLIRHDRLLMLPQLREDDAEIRVRLSVSGRIFKQRAVLVRRLLELSRALKLNRAVES